MRRSLLILLLTASCAPAGDLAGPRPAARSTPVAPAPAQPIESPLLQRIAVVGASASAGFGLERVNEGHPIDLARVLDAAVRGAHDPPVAHASPFFFVNPRQNAEAYVAAALEDEPTMVVALDFLFWFTYGVYPNEAARLRFLERGLAYLDRFECTVLTSEIPLMSEAVGKMLIPLQVPHEHTLADANQRIREWAAERDNVHIVPLVSFLADVKAGRAVRIRDHEWPAGSLDRLLQVDQLHPTVEGLAGLALLCLDTLVRTGRLPAAAVRWQPGAITATAQRRVEATDPSR